MSVKKECIMYVTTKSIVEDLPTNLRLISVLFEAITNSIQAKASNIDIIFETTTLGQSSMDQEIENIKNLSIKDDGIGFTDKNLKSFNHYKSDYKKELGCKGIGRFTYLTICEKVKIESYNNNEQINFNFSMDINTVEAEKRSELKDKHTIVKLENIRDKTINKNLEKEKNDIINHFISIFMFETKINRKILINLFKDGKKMHTINSLEEGKGFKNESFKIKNEDFNVYYKKKGTTIKGFYCANSRAVKRDDLNIKLNFKNGEGLLFFTTSTFFDRTVNNIRNNFNIKDSADALFDESLDWKTINKFVYSKVDKICKKNGINIDEKAEKNKQESLKSVPFLAHYINKSINKSSPSAIIKEAKEGFQKDKDYIRDTRNKGKPDYEEKLYISTQAELAEYMFDREKIINDIKSDIENPNKKSNETIIHNKIMSRRTQNDNYTSYKENNLWLFDERFMIYSYAHSDDTINNILGLSDTDKNTRPDICIFTKSENDIKEIILIELKGSDATGEKNAGGLNELNKYTRKIKNHFEQNGEEILIWSYLITSLNSETKQEIEDFPGVKKTYTTKGELYYLYNENLNAITHILTLETMVEDAMARNKLFLDILRGNTN